MDSELLKKIDQIDHDVERMEEAFTKYRNHWNVQTKKLFPMLKNMDKLSEAQILFLSYRHQITDVKFKNLSLINEKNDLKKMCEKGLRSAYKDLKITERKNRLEQDLSKLIRYIEVLDIWVDYCDTLIDTLDKMSYAFKYRIDVEKMK